MSDRPSHRERPRRQQQSLGDQFAEVLSQVQTVAPPAQPRRPPRPRQEPRTTRQNTPVQTTTPVATDEPTPRPEKKPPFVPNFCLRYVHCENLLNKWWSNPVPHDDGSTVVSMIYQRKIKAQVVTYANKNTMYFVSVNRAPMSSDPVWENVVSGSYSTASDNTLMAKLSAQVAFDAYVSEWQKTEPRKEK